MVEHPDASPGFLLWHVTLRWQRAVAAGLKPLGLTHVQFVLLASTWWLNEQGRQPSQAAVAAQAGTDIKMTSEVLRTLERKQLLIRSVDPADSRARRLTLTSAGSALAPQAIAVVEAIDQDLLGPLSPSMARTFTRTLLRLRG